jgi:hypothetical protein
LAGGLRLLAPLVVAGVLASYGGEHSVAVRVAVVGIVASEMLLQALIAPMSGYQQRHELWNLVPFLGWVIAWKLGTVLSRHCRAGSPDVRDASVHARH